MKIFMMSKRAGKTAIQKMIVSNTFLKNKLLMWRRQWLDLMEKQPSSGLTMPT